MAVEFGALYVVATPIGNVEDISARALRVLREVDCIAAEDTRHTGQLLRYFGIETPLLSLHEHNERDRLDQIVARLREGKTLALVSDAGTPLISDPGFPLVRELRQQALPGDPDTCSQQHSGGIISSRDCRRIALSLKAFCLLDQQLAANACKPWRRKPALWFCWRPATGLLKPWPIWRRFFAASGRAVIARELTKRFEEVHGATLDELIRWLDTAPNRHKGEFVVLTHGATTTNEADTPENQRPAHHVIGENAAQPGGRGRRQTHRPGEKAAV